MKNCLIVDKMHDSIVPLLKEIDIAPHYRPDIQRKEILEIIGDYEGLIIRSKTTVDQEMIGQAHKLEFIGRAGAGLDQLNVQLLEQRNIKIVNAPEGNRDALAEHGIGMLLCLMNKINQADQQIRNGIWDREGNRGVELMGKTVGIIGYGYMGQAFAQRLSSFGVRVLAYDKYKEHYGNEYAEEASMQQLYDEADIFSLHIPLTAETLFFIDEDYLSRFKKNIFLLNTARGKVIKLQTLHQAIENGKIRGAALDVLENEKLRQFSEEQQHYFWQLKKSDRILFTPHVAGWTFESYEKINQVLVNKLKVLNMA